MTFSTLLGIILVMLMVAFGLRLFAVIATLANLLSGHLQWREW